MHGILETKRESKDRQKQERIKAAEELEAEEEKLWKEQVEAARARAGSEKVRYRRMREVHPTGHPMT